MRTIRLGDLAYARSGDKGSSANIGLIARSPREYDILRDHVTAGAVERYFSPMGVGRVVRYELPNLHAFNFILPGILGDGGSISPRIDAQGKALGQVLLEMLIDI
jgi:hypothetical protein